MFKLSGLLAVLGLGFLLVALAVWPTESVGIERPALAERGRALFVAKGCVMCHRHHGLGELGPDRGALIGPDLSRYQPSPDFVRRWLREPGAIRPGTAMPDLDLSEDEITALIAFLGQAQPAPPAKLSQ
ncbi:MAG: cytochrome c [Candidatus Promineifilaceae bacterium]|nr:cytochrome c [Candidatus Promineifilaceae bacterium]